MTPPISIDGTDITGASIDGTDVQEITVDGQTVFSAEKIIDDFEDGNINEYNGDTGDYSVTSSNPISGSSSLLSTAGSFATPYIHSTSGLQNYPQAGDTFSYKIRIEGTINVSSGLVFGIQSNTSQNYALLIFSASGADRIEFRKNVASGSLGTQISAQNVSTFTNDVIRFEVDWGTNGTISVDVINEGTNTVDTVSFTDSDYTSGGIGFANGKFTSSEQPPNRILCDDIKIL